jgi:hypothetical protein
MPSRTLQIDAPRLRSRIGNRPILASRVKYFNKNMIMAIGEGLTAKGRERTNVQDFTFCLLPFAIRHSPSPSIPRFVKFCIPIERNVKRTAGFPVFFSPAGQIQPSLFQILERMLPAMHPMAYRLQTLSPF